MTKIIIAAPQRDEERVAGIRQRHPDAELVVVANRDQVLDQIGDADGLFGAVNAMEFAAAEQIRWIQAGSAGVEWLWNVPALQARDDVTVTNMRSAHASTIADHCFAMLLNFTRGLTEFMALQDREEWGRGQLANRRSPHGLTIGIVGFGNIGRAIGRRARLRDEGAGRRCAPGPARRRRQGGLAALPPRRDVQADRRARDLRADHPADPWADRTAQIGMLKRGSYLCVMSRGNIVDEPAVIEALKSGQIAGAGFDVTHQEPLPSGDPLWKAPNCIVTPHNSAGSKVTTNIVWRIFEENLGRFERGEPLMNVVDKSLGY